MPSLLFLLPLYAGGWLMRAYDVSHRRLRIGNARFASGDLAGFLGNLAMEMNPDARVSLTASQVRCFGVAFALSLLPCTQPLLVCVCVCDAVEQNPYAVVVTCADSRVAPELIFDEGMGFLFVIRHVERAVTTTNCATVSH
jgi:cytochrome c biogenesis protein CcdA